MLQSWLARSALAALCLASIGCAGQKMYLNQTHRAANTLPVAGGMVAFPSGVSMEISGILKLERKVEKVVMTRLFGNYLVTAEGFGRVWLIKPCGRTGGRFRPLKLPGKGPLVNPRFQHSEGSNCVALLWGTPGEERRAYITYDGTVGRRCADVKKD